MNKFHEGSLIYPLNLSLNVMDMDLMTRFYKDSLGLEILEKKNDFVDLGVDGRRILSLVRPENVIQKPPRRTGLYHFAILLPTRKHLGSFINHLRDANVPVTGGADHEVSEALYLQDPEDNGIEVYADIPDSKWEWDGDQVQMGTDPLDFRGLMELGRDTPWTGMPEGTRLGHMHLHVGDLEEAYRFYGLMGFKRVAQLAGSANFISTGGYHHHIGLNVWNGRGAKPAPENATGLRHYTLAAPDSEALEKIFESLQGQNYQAEMEDGVLFTKDPSGNRIQIIIP